MSWFSDLADSLFTGDQIAEQEDFLKRSAAEEQRRVERGLETPEQAQARVAAQTDDYRGQAWEALKEGAAEGLQNEQDFVKGSINGVTSGFLGFFPTWLKVAAVLAGLGVVAWYLGLGTYARGIFAKK